jgi:hypothetical protein
MHALGDLKWQIIANLRSEIRLGHNELLKLFRDFRILHYREGKFAQDGKEA